MARRRRPLVAIAVGVLAVGLLVSAGALALRGRPSEPAFGRFAAPLFVDPQSVAAEQVATLRSTGDTASAARLAPLVRHATATWFTQPGDAVQEAVAAVATRARAAHAVPVLVTYAIPGRDCGGQSAASVTASPTEYRSWIRQFVAGLGRVHAIVVVEPDALAQLDCLPEAQQRERVAMLRYAVGRIEAQGSWAYLDAGNSAWQPAAVMSARLREAGVAAAAGFSLNVANFQPTASERAFGHEIAQRLGGDVHFVVDTSRNGAGPDGGNWCNPPGRRLGTAPTERTGDPLVDAYVWVKIPGESDGECNGGPPAGQWWLENALELTG